MAKDEQGIRESEEERIRVIQKFGLVPTSILRHDNSDKAIDLTIDEGRGYFNESDKKNLRRIDERHGLSDAAKMKLFKRIRISSAGVRGASLGLSRFSQNVGRIFVKLYSEPGDVVFDPCAGHNSRMQLVYECGRNYIGYDVSQEFMAANFKTREILLGERGQAKLLQQDNFIDLKEQDSRFVPLGDESVDFILTSPPYWDIEFYGNEPGQIGHGRTYEEFLSDLLLIVKQCHRVLRPNKFCVFCVNDFRKGGKFYSYHSDVIRLFREAGFTIWDTAIIDLVEHPIRAIFASQIETTKILPKRHEYAICGRKPYTT